MRKQGRGGTGRSDKKENSVNIIYEIKIKEKNYSSSHLRNFKMLKMLMPPGAFDLDYMDFSL